MLNTLPRSSVPLQPPRRRGGQPSNRNALKHGLYARQHPTPLTPFLISLARCQLLLAEKNPASLDLAIQDLDDQRNVLVGLLQSVAELPDVSSFLALLNVFQRTASISRRMHILHHQIQQPFHDLQFVAAHALALIIYNFREYSITRDADSFLKNNKKSYLNSTLSLDELCPPFSEPEFPFLAPRQWDVLEPLLPPSHPTSSSPLSNYEVIGEGPGVGPEVGLGEAPSMGVRPGRPPADPHLVIDAIFWKMAHHARWQELPLGCPSMAVCRRYYRRIFRSGRLCTLYRHLYKDLCARGRLDLTTLVERGCFTIQGNKVLLRPGLPETWRLRTALLFMQLGFQILRRIRREKDQERRRKFPLRMSSSRSLHARPQRREAEFHFTPLLAPVHGPKYVLASHSTPSPAASKSSSPLLSLPSPGCVLPSGEGPGVGLPSPGCVLPPGQGPGVGPPSPFLLITRNSSLLSALYSCSLFSTLCSLSQCVRILNVNEPGLVLASNSPRRRELLALFGRTFQSRPADVDESQRPGEAPAQYVQRLALDKVHASLRRPALPAPVAQAQVAASSGYRPGLSARTGRYRCAVSAQPGELILAADTAVVDGQAILGKPGDASDAAGMLRQLRGHTHQVLTGLAVLRASDGKLVTDLCITDVPMRDYRDDEIEAYVATGDPLDKAGAYAVQHAGFHPVEGLRGCQASVMGLPLCHLARSLRKLELEPAGGIAAACQSALGYACPISSAVLRGEMVG